MTWKGCMKILRNSPAFYRPELYLSAMQRDVIKIIAFMAMVGDHIATSFGLGVPILNVIGRCAFPLFALVCGCNLAGKMVRQNTINKLWMWAILAQPGYWLAFRGEGLQWWQVNILFTFAVVMQMNRFYQHANLSNGFAAFATLVGYLPLSSASYGIPGLLMLACAFLIWQVKSQLLPEVFVIWLLLIAMLNVQYGELVMLSGVLLTSTVSFCVYGLIPASERRIPVGRWFAPAYAVHLMLIGICCLLLS